ncbi:hypothetical protein Daus18300_010277 [Diaporthe australafricana]|uniref:Uncharacterized protein n=1 Tax=Diaporthe australafricana TaxID=127596 RepID=A0ABR3WAY4_9PEZI
MASRTAAPAFKLTPAGTVKPKASAVGTAKPNPSQHTSQKLGHNAMSSSASPEPGQTQTRPSNGGAPKRTGDSGGVKDHQASVSPSAAKAAVPPSKSKASVPPSKSKAMVPPSGAKAMVPPSKSKPSGPPIMATLSGNQATRGSASHTHATGSSSSRIPTSSTAQNHEEPVRDKRSREEERKDKGNPNAGGSGYSLVKIVVYISGGRPDYFFNRHVKAHFTSPQAPSMHETVHAHRIADPGLWEVMRETWRQESELMGSSRFLGRMDPVWVCVKRGQERVPADILASVSVANREPEWNCQHFLLDGFKKLAESGYKTLEWYDKFESELLDKIEEGALEW